MNYLKSLLFLLLLASTYLQADESEDISQLEISLSAECEPITTVADCVNVVSGHFFQIDHDLIGNTVDPIRLIRCYDSGNKMEGFLGSGFGAQFPFFASDVQEGKEHSYALIEERDGFLIPYKGRARGSTHTCRIDPRLLKKGYTNLSRAALSGHANYVNCKATYKEDSNGGYWTVQLGNGGKRLYRNPIKLSRERKHEIGFPTRTVYLLEEEIKPNGNRLKFDYQIINGNPLISKIRTFNRTGKRQLNELKFSYFSPDCKVQSSCGKSCSYKQRMEVHVNFTAITGKNILEAVDSSQNGSITYTAPPGHKKPKKVVRVERPDGRSLSITYDKDKVESIKEPLGRNGALVTTYRFKYDKKEAKVWDAHNQLTIYRIDPNKRLSQIDQFEKDKIIRQEVFEWSSKEGEEGWLKTKSIRLGKEIYLLTSYKYDERGNILSQTTWGNITGEKQSSFTKEELKNSDSYTLEYEYTNDERNLIKSKTTPEGWKTTYAYLPKTNLCTQEFHHYNGKIQERIFRNFDENGQESSCIEDNGSREEAADLTDVTYRRVKITRACQQEGKPSFGKPQKIEEFYLNQESKELIPQKKQNSFMIFLAMRLAGRFIHK